MPKFISHNGPPDPIRDEVLEALLHSDRAQHDELGRTPAQVVIGDPPSHAGPREQGAAPIDLDNVDE